MPEADAALRARIAALEADHGDIRERLAILETERRTAEERTRSYVDASFKAALKSINHNIAATGHDIRSEIQAIGTVVHGANGDNGLKSAMGQARLVMRLQWWAIGLLASGLGLLKLGILPI